MKKNRNQTFGVRRCKETENDVSGDLLTQQNKEQKMKNDVTNKRIKKEAQNNKKDSPNEM